MKDACRIAAMRSQSDDKAVQDSVSDHDSGMCLNQLHHGTHRDDSGAEEIN